jgi:hypothetical protein
VIIAKIDMSANDVRGHDDVKSFPTIKFFPALANPSNKKKAILYEGDRLEEDFIHFIK